MSAMKILFASSNPHKVEEVRAILAPLGISVKGLDSPELAVILSSSGPDHGGEPVESGDTFESNAEIKAVHWARMLRRPCLADDSGLEVDALGGAPGVRSARYADVPAGASRAERDAANNRKLLEALRGVPAQRRAARFVCAMCLADATGRVVARARGVFDGVIAEAPAGSSGFGYDPLLYLPDAGCTSAELAPARKNARSHRGAAARAMALRMAELGPLLGPQAGAAREASPRSRPGGGADRTSR